MNTEQQELIPAPSVDLTRQAPTPMDLIEIATRQGADIEKLRVLMELQLKWEANEARKAFARDLAVFKANPPEIYKNKHVKFGQTEYDHATLDNVTDAVTEALSKYGFSHRWSVDQNGGIIRVTCELTHKSGHSERVSMEALPDTSGSKNAIQAIGSAVTYLERYTLLAATGMAARGQDNDANGAGGAKDGGMPAHELNEKLEWIANCGNLAELHKFYVQSYKAATDYKDQGAMRQIVAAKDKRKAELQ